ncbi:DNA-directed RNA polymerase III subunit RPC3-like isoform X2 [Gigantopelta aegis]|uniref:DNA-directed RNA polymerase III subunit RPC3-like isoform X2 n=1 Tax=Gigantopelta aegis TaxID=1735272 RepID=UPI001B889839|nr:DNA-directed RNA polymerase III subunit RPC3-like isoform X2 [Gigantopelta aegis]
MSRCKINVCIRLLKELYGELPSKTKKVLWILIQQNIVTFDQSKRSGLEYTIDTDHVLWRLRFPKYIYCAKALYGDAAELLVEELLHEGQGVIGNVVQKVTDKLNEALETAGHTRIQSSLVRDKFSSLVRTHFLQRCPNPVRDAKQRVISLENPAQSETLFVLPLMDVDDVSTSKRKRSVDDSTQPIKKIKTEGSSSVQDDVVYWRINFERFHQHFRDQAIIDAVSKKIDKKASEIVRTMLRLSEVKTDPFAEVTLPLSFTEIFQSLSKDHGMTKLVLDQYLSIISDDSAGFITKVGESGGGMFVVNMLKVLTALCTAHVESVVQERFGSKCLRIFRVLLLKKQIEQKQIEDYAMIPAKEAKEMLYSLLEENFITFTEVSKTVDHAPSRTYYLFNVHLIHVTRMLLEHTYKAAANAMVRREMEVNEHKRLLDKQERVEAIISTLEQDDETQKEEIEQMITPPERVQLEKVKVAVNKLDNCEIQLDDTIFLLETYLAYTMKPPPVKPSKT